MEPSIPSLILVVDDNSNNIKVLVDLLREAGHRVLVANSGESALEKVQVVSPDLILLDIMMPGIDGFETCTRLKSNEKTQDIPVIFSSALSDTVDKVKGLQLGAVDYITKPFQQDEVLARVNVHLKLYHLSRELERRVEERTARLTETLSQLQHSQLQLIQSEKLSTLGQLVAGVGHEINNPISFIDGNLQYAQRYAIDVLALLNLYQQEFPIPTEKIVVKSDEIDIEYLQEDFLKLIGSMQEGINRIIAISQSLRNFSRTDFDRTSEFNLHDGLDSTLLILKYRLKNAESGTGITISKQYGELPEIRCYPGQLNQVFMNLLGNAIEALEEAETAYPEITITTEAIDGQWVQVAIADNGSGIDAAIQAKLFEPFFTTKPAGKGTGLGLSISYEIIVKQHKGTLQCISRPGEGTTFLITLPVQPQ
jgi:two-component system, NtrC family, sensor kinase